MADVSLTLVVLKTRQVEQLRCFYQTLGVELADEQHGQGPVHLAGRVGDVVIEVYPLPDDGSPADSSIRLGFAVENVAEVVQALEGIGTKIVTPPKETAWGLQGVERPGRSIRRTDAATMSAAGGRRWAATRMDFDLWRNTRSCQSNESNTLPTPDEKTVLAIRRGVLFLMAFWSGPSVKAFAKLTEVLASLPSHDLEFVVVDVDGSFPLYELPEFKGLISGCGETAWVRDGRIIATSGPGLNVECFEPNTLALLSMP